MIKLTLFSPCKMPLQQLQMIGDLKAENAILKEANENLVNR